MPLIIPSNSISDLGYEVDNSLRFEDGNTAHLKKTFSVDGNRRTFTFSSWVKLSSFIPNEYIFGGGSNSNNQFFLAIISNGQLMFRQEVSNNPISKTSSVLLRDLSAWYHIVLSVDTTQSSESDRVKLYVNNELLSFTGDSFPQNYQGIINDATYNHYLGALRDDALGGFDGYLAETVFIDGQQLDPTSFGEFDADSGIWKPIDVSGLTFGTNGFYLDFENSGSLGADVSGNGNSFTVNNLTSDDQSTDTCTNNYATWNPLINIRSQTFAEGNTEVSTSVSGLTGGSSTIGMSSGKWYAEFKITGYDTNRIILGIASNPSELDRTNTSLSSANNNVGLYYNGSIYLNGSIAATVSSFTLNDIIGVAVNLDGSNILFYKNGVVQNSGTPLSITPSSSTDTGNYFFATGDGSFAAYGTVQANFGSPPFTISSGNSDGNGRGNFEYAVPSGYFALCTSNLAEHG